MADWSDWYTKEDPDHVGPGGDACAGAPEAAPSAVS